MNWLVRNVSGHLSLLSTYRYTCSRWNAMAASHSASSDFLKAAFDGNLRLLQRLLKRLASETGNGGDLTKAYEMVTDANRRNALHLAAVAGNTPICKFLVEELKFDVDFRDKEGNTPLIEAIEEQHHPTAVYLIENGAGIGCRNRSGFTPFHVAAIKEPKELLQLLLSKGDLKLLDNDADPNSATWLCFTPLMLSIMFRSYECMELLLKAGADPNHGSHEMTPLFLATCGEEDRGLIEHLLKAGANPDVVEPSRLLTPLEHAALGQKVDVVKALFPFTSRISYFPDWSVDGIMNHVHSKEAIAQRANWRKEDCEVSKAKGEEAFKRKDYEAAVYWYSQANGSDPTNETVLSNRSLCWVILDQPRSALEDAKACVALKPDSPKSHYLEGAVYMILHEYSMATMAFSKALKLDPNDEDIKIALREALEANFGVPVSENFKVMHL